MNLDISSMLQDLLETEAELERRQKAGLQSSGPSQTSIKSVSFRDEGNTPVAETILYAQDEPITESSEQVKIRKTEEAKSILKTPSVTIVPTEIPLEPMEYESENEQKQRFVVGDEDDTGSESDSSEDSLDFQSDGEEDVRDEDIEFDEEGDMFQDNDDTSSVYENTIVRVDSSKNFDEIMEVLDEFISNHHSQMSPVETTIAESDRLNSAPATTLSELRPLAYAGPPQESTAVSFYGQQIQNESQRRGSLPDLKRPVRHQSNIEHVEETASPLKGREIERSYSERPSDISTSKLLDKIEKQVLGKPEKPKDDKKQEKDKDLKKVFSIY
jgi:hypothetical protein